MTWQNQQNECVHWQNLAQEIAKWHFSLVEAILSKYSKWFKSYISLFSEFEPRQNLDRSKF